jgi:hypothetical protein
MHRTLTRRADEINFQKSLDRPFQLMTTATRLLLGTWVGLVASLATLMSPPASQAAPLEAYGRLPSMEYVSISPDGTRIALIRTAGGERHIEVRSLFDHKVLARFKVGEEKLRALEMVDDHRVMLVTSKTTVPAGFVGPKSEWFRLVVYDLAKWQSIAIPDWSKIVNREGIFQRIDPMDAISGPVVVRRVNGHTVLFFRTYFAIVRPVPALMQADLDSGDERLLRVASVDGSRQSLGWAVDAEGKVLAEQNYYEKEQRWSVSAFRNGDWQEIASGKASIEFPRLLGFGSTSETLLMRVEENGQAAWKPLSLKDGSVQPVKRLFLRMKDPSRQLTGSVA